MFRNTIIAVLAYTFYYIYLLKMKTLIQSSCSNKKDIYTIFKVECGSNEAADKVNAPLTILEVTVLAGAQEMHGDLVPEEVHTRQIGQTGLEELRQREQTRLGAHMGQIAALDRQPQKRLDHVVQGRVARAPRRLEHLRQHAADERDLALHGRCDHTRAAY